MDKMNISIAPAACDECGWIEPADGLFVLHCDKGHRIDDKKYCLSCAEEKQKTPPNKLDIHCICKDGDK